METQRIYERTELTVSKIAVFSSTLINFYIFIGIVLWSQLYSILSDPLCLELGANGNTFGLDLGAFQFDLFSQYITLFELRLRC